MVKNGVFRGMGKLNKTIVNAMLALGLAATSVACWAGLDAGIEAYNAGDYAMAMHELRPLAEKNDAKAQRYIAAMYENGLGVPQDERQAVVWYSNAAIGGNPDAQTALADMYSSGRGVPPDSVIAAYWRWRSSNLFASAAKKQLEASLSKNSGVLGAPGAADSARESGCTAPQYHADPAHFGLDSTMDLMFLIGADGKTVDSAVATTSAWPLLDKLARDAFAACSFTPATVNGKAAPSLIKATFSWKTK
jgi:TPR repeat protein